MTSFLYTFDETADEPIMLIDRNIGFDEADGFGIMGDQFQRELLALDAMEKKRIQVWINSPGGVVADGYNIYNAILKTKTKVDTYCTGIAASIAAVIFQAGRTRYMADYGKLMYHNPYGGNDDKGLDAIRDSLVTMISTRTGCEDDVIKKMMNKTTWMAADEAKQAGFCDEVQASAEHNKKRSINTPEEAKAFWKSSNKILNQIFKPENIISMKKVANKLSLNADASEESIVAEIEKVELKANNAVEALNKKTDEFKKKQEELDAANKKVTDLSAEMDSMKAKAKEDADAKAKADADAKTKADADEADKAKNMIEGFAKAGRIKNDAAVITEWADNCKVLGITKVKAMIEALPVNATAAKIQIQTGSAKGKLGSVVANKMGELQAKMAGTI